MMAKKATPPRPDTLEKNLHQMITPEGVPLDLEIALAGDRLTAFILDALIILGVIFITQLLAFWSGIIELQAFFLVFFFLWRNFYFMFFEHRWQGATLGKKNRKLRVIDAHGGQLTVEAIIVRNLTRDIEIFIPLVVLIAPEAVWPTAPPFVAPVAGLWILVLGLMPLFNRQRRRVGDLIAGTLVIVSPQVQLLGDLADTKSQAAQPRSEQGLVFSKLQLSVYGVYELQVLEKVLRRSGFDSAQEQMVTVREKICEKIGWTETVKDDHAFLEAFYSAQRAHLEGRMLMGDRREDKFGGTVPTAED